MHRRVTVLVLCVCVCVSVCVTVCLSVTTLAATSVIFMPKMRYIAYAFLGFNALIFNKSFRSEVIA